MFSIKSERGNTILMLLVLLAGISMATIAMFGSSQVYDTSGARFLARQKALYVSDGTRAIVIQLTQDYLKEKPDATDDDLKEYLGTALPPLLPSGYSVKDISVQMTPQGSLIIPNGTFKGMVAPQAQVKFGYTITSGADSENMISHHFEAVVSLAQVGLHQFMYFIDLESAGFSPGPRTEVSGRIHANGDLCIAGGNGLTLAKVSAAGRLMHSNRAECGVNKTVGYPLTKTYISNGSGTQQFGLGTTDSTRNDNGCVNCLGTGLNWAEYAQAAWNGNVQDVAHSVPKLTLPLPSDIKAQVGANGPNPYVGYSNNKNLRFLVDPIVPGEPESVKKMKYAYNADVRIIDGVWYLRSRSNPDEWPGRAIWSDHPGSFQDGWGHNVGQADLASALGWSTVPKRFSYYDYNSLTHTVSGAASGTISYGGLARTVNAAGKPSWYPGQLVGEDEKLASVVVASANHLCPKPDPSTETYGSLPVTVPGRRMLLYSQALTCNPGSTSPTPATALINATRSGINDPHVAWYAKIVYHMYPHSTTIPNDRSHILPVNFDVEHFQAALTDTTHGELGSYFTHDGSKTDFNGIVYVTTTWPGSENGFSPRNAPVSWPVQNDGGWPAYGTSVQSRLGDRDQIQLTAQEQQRSLPYQLCAKGAPAGQAYDRGVTGGYHFVVPDCAKYPSVFNAYPNAIRIHNGANISTSVFSKGLSVVSNMPVYILGSYNQNSNVGGSGTDSPWVPALIAGDQITLLSNAWDDVNDPFAIFGAPTNWTANRIASDTSYTVSLISGWAMHAPLSPATNEAIHSMPALMENWTGYGQKLTLTGSIALGYYPVYYRGGRYYYDNFNGSGAVSSYNFATYRAGSKMINYDNHLEQIANQPPGSPVFYTSSTLSWKIK